MGKSGNKEIDDLMQVASDAIEKATKIAIEKGVSLYNPIPALDDCYPALQFYPRGLPLKDYPWFWEPRDDERSEEKKREEAERYAGEWCSSSNNCD